MGARRPSARHEPVGKHRAPWAEHVNEIPLLHEPVPQRACTRTGVRCRPRGYPGEAAHVPAAWSQRDADAASQVDLPKLGLLRNRLPVVVDEIAVFRRHVGAAELQPEDRVYARGHGHADIQRERWCVEVSAVDRELPLDEVEEIAAGAREHPTCTKSY